MWMGGYASRNRPSEGIVQELYAKVLVLEDGAGNRLAIVTTDLLGIPRSLREVVVERLERRVKLPGRSLLLNASHTHCGPELRTERAGHYGDGTEHVRQATVYAGQLADKIVDLVAEAIDRLQPARLSYSHARAGFAMNRRLKAGQAYINRPNPDGPVDHAVPVLRVDGPNGDLRAVLFGYACHNTTMRLYKFFGDYAGCAQEYVDEAHPGVTALFLMGCGGDQNPYPRRKLRLARQHGRALANGVETALQAKSHPLGGRLQVALEPVTLEFASVPSREQLLQLAASQNRFDRRRGSFLLEKIDSGEGIAREYSYPVQVAQLGSELTLVALAGETVVDYSLRLKKELPGPFVWVAGYSNDVFGYVPSARVLGEGGYEAGGAMRYTLFPGPFAPSVEQRIVSKVMELAERLQAGSE
jgi:hypothetical protein